MYKQITFSSFSGSSKYGMLVGMKNKAKLENVCYQMQQAHKWHPNQLLDCVNIPCYNREYSCGSRRLYCGVPVIESFGLYGIAWPCH